MFAILVMDSGLASLHTSSRARDQLDLAFRRRCNVARDRRHHPGGRCIASTRPKL